MFIKKLQYNNPKINALRCELSIYNNNKKIKRNIIVSCCYVAYYWIEMQQKSHLHAIVISFDNACYCNFH